MTWLGGMRRAPAPTPGAPPPPERHSAPGLAQALARLEGRPARILDLGPALHANLGRLARLAPRLAIADLSTTLAEANSALAALDDTFQALPPGGPAEPYELVLAWDLPDQLGRDLLPRLAGHLVPRCADGCLLHALLSTGKLIPALPRRYRIREGDQLEEERLSAEERGAPRLQPGELDRLLPGFVVDKSLLHAHGVHEVLLMRTDHVETPITRMAPLRRELRKTLPRGRQG
jgi:hypothetical protein